MSARTLLGLSAVLLLTAAVPARADGPVPQAFKELKAYQIVEQVMAQRQLLALTDAQFYRLDDLSNTIRTEKHRFVHQGGKPHNTTHVTMVSRQEAFDRAMAILSDDQRLRFEAFFPAPAKASLTVSRYTAPHGKP